MVRNFLFIGFFFLFFQQKTILHFVTLIIYSKKTLCKGWKQPKKQKINNLADKREKKKHSSIDHKFFTLATKSAY